MLHCYDRQRLYDSGIEEDQKKERTSDGRRRTSNTTATASCRYYFYTSQGKVEGDTTETSEAPLRIIYLIFILSVYVS